MSNWNFGGTRLNGVSDPGVLDLKALLNQVTGGTLGTSLGGLSAAVGSGNRTVGGGGHSSSHRLGSGGYPNPAGVIGGGIGGGSSCLDGGSGGNNGASPFFDPFSSMSTFGFFNPKDPGGNNLRDASGGTGGGGGGHHLNSGGMGHSNKSPTYHSSTNNSHSPVFGGSHSPINFFGGGSGGGGSNHQQQQQHNNHFSSSTNSSYANTDKFPISTFSINDTIPGRERDNSSSMFSNSDDISSNGHNSHFGNNSSHFGNSNNYRGGDRGDRDNRDNYNNSNSSSSNHNNHHQGHPANATTNNRSNEHGENSFNQGVRETGIIEKLLHSYGFIQCCERQARLFFHFSQFDGTIEHLKLGDPVEFEMTYDRRTGKPIASAVTKIGPEVLSEERVTGTVTTELHHESNGELQGRISYENRGECFFLPYCKEDIEGNVSLSVGDTVSFQIATNQRSGNLTARYCRLENPARPVRYKGIVSSLKDNFGFIERADVAKEIFFHFSETRINEAITVNDNVEFNIQTRNGKEVACTITKLPTGTVVFEDIGTDTLKGQILKPIDKTQCPSPTLGPTPRSESAEGRLRYRGPDRQELEVVYGEKDQRGSFTMKHGDWVQFQLAIDRRNKQQRATNVHLLEESFSVSGERREEGVVSAIKGDCGFITCAERDSKMFFRFSELLDYTREPRIADDVEFTIIQDSTSPIRQSAIRIKYLKHGTVQFELPVSQGLHGVVVREPSTPWVSQEALVGILPSLSNLGLPPNVTERLIQSLSSAEVLSQLTGASNDAQGEPGVIQYTTSNGWQQDTIIFHWKDCKNLRNIRVGTKVVFDIHQVRRNRDFVAANIRAESGSDLDSPTGNSSSNLGNNLLQTFRLSPTSHLGSGNCLNGPVGSGRQSPPLSSAMGNMLNSILGGGGGNSSMNSANEANHVNDLLNSAQAQIMAEKLENCSNNSMDNNHLGFSNNSGSNRSLAGSVGEIGSSRNHSIVVSGGGSGSYGTTLTSMHNNNAESNSNNTGSNCINMGLNLSHGLGENQRENQNQRAISPIQQQQQQQNGSLYNSSSLSSTEFDDLALDSDQLRRTSRSPSDSSVEKMMLNRSMYSGYAPDESPSPPHSSSNSKSPRVVMKGYIAALKDGFGFIETMAQDGEIFFHSSSLVGDFAAIEVGQEVEYVVSSKASSSGKNAADIVKPLPKGSIGRAAVFPDILQGAVVRPLRGANPDQTEYTGLIDGQDGQAYPFGIISMLNKKELLQSGEDVEFQLDAQQKPVNIRAIRKKLRAAVEAVKGQYGFLSYELEDGKKLFFHMSEVKDHQHLNPGDEVEFVILQNPRNGKSSACSVVKVGESQRPERLLNRLSKLSVDETAPRLVVVRQPFGPDGTRGFSQPRVARKPGSLSSSRDSTSSTGSN